jgi:hypothetical protein
MPLVLAGATSGATTLQSTDGATQTITLPNNTGTVLTTATNTNFPAGSVLQVVQTVKSDTFTTSSSSFADITGLSVSITPTNSTSKIFVLVNLSASMTVSGWNSLFRLLRDSTVVYNGNSAGNRSLGFGSLYLGNTQDVRSINAVFLDSPSTTSAITYKVQCFAQTGSSGSVTINRSGNDGDSAEIIRSASSITVMEIKG